MSVPDSERVRSKVLLTLFSKHGVKGYNKAACGDTFDAGAEKRNISKEESFKGKGIPCQN